MAESTAVQETDDGSAGAPQLPTDRLKDAAQLLLRSVTERAVDVALERVDSLTERLSGVAENGGVGLGSALGGGKAMLQGENPVMGAVKGGLSSAKDKVLGAVGLGGSEESGGGPGGGSGGGQRGKFKFMNIVEELDVGVPVRVAYDQWTQFADFPSFMKKLHSVEQESDEKTTWRAQVFWSKRTWNATIIEQVPDSHIVWRSGGAKGYVNGIVSFHELAPQLTKVLLVLEYYPVGLFEKTGNLWRAVGRRARLEFKHYRRHVMVETLVHQEELEGWRGEIRDSEVVKTHEEALEEERAAAEDDDEYGDPDAEYADEVYDDEDGYDTEDAEDEDPDADLDDPDAELDDAEDGYDDEALEPADEYDDADYDDADSADDDADADYEDTAREIDAEDAEDPREYADYDAEEPADDDRDSGGDRNGASGGRAAPRRRRAGRS